MTPDQLAILNKWARTRDERTAIEKFLDWAQRNGLSVSLDTGNLSDLLDRFYGINRRDLEDARRSLLGGHLGDKRMF